MTLIPTNQGPSFPGYLAAWVTPFPGHTLTAFSKGPMAASLPYEATRG